jgi:hypothetical protein
MLLDTLICFRVPPVCTPCTALNLKGLQTMLKNNILSLTPGSVKLKTIMTLSNPKGKQITEDATPKVFWEIFEQCLLCAYPAGGAGGGVRVGRVCVVVMVTGAVGSGRDGGNLGAASVSGGPSGEGRFQVDRRLILICKATITAHSQHF